MRIFIIACALLASSVVDHRVGPARQADAASRDAGLKKVLDDYIRLYARETLAEWRGLFLSTFVAGSINDDGTVTTRTFEEFYERQRGFFATGRAIRETLENVRVERDGRLATMRADFVLHDNDERRRGKLMMLLVETRGEFKIHSLIFTYHLD
jgi:SnoaL-like domain